MNQRVLGVKLTIIAICGGGQCAVEKAGDEVRVRRASRVNTIAVPPNEEDAMNRFGSSILWVRRSILLAMFIVLGMRSADAQALCPPICAEDVVSQLPGTEECALVVVPDTEYSKPVRVEGVDFEVVACKQWVRPAEVYGTGTTSIGLRISNRSDQDVKFDLRGKLRLSLQSGDCTELIKGPVPEQLYPEPLTVAADTSKTLMLPSYLFHTRIHSVSLGLKSTIGWNWLSADIPPGEYRLRVSYENTERSDDVWCGKMKTEPLVIEVRPAD